jgi:protein-S-isoprenylcysteine O-methyltransferase Ste14
VPNLSVGNLSHGESFDEIEASIKMLESRYAFENELMRAVTLGQQHKASSLLSGYHEEMFERRTQDTVIKLSGLMFLCGFVLAGLDFRFSWLPIPFGVSVGASVAFLLAYILYAEVLRENAYLSRTIKVEEGQRVVDTGLYGIVRHPMYSATLLLFLSMPLVLGSLVALIPFLFYPVIITVRLLNEEKLLEAELDGYLAYQKKVKWRLIPFIY